SKHQGTGSTTTGRTGAGRDAHDVGTVLNDIDGAGGGIRAEVVPIDSPAVKIGVAFVGARITDSDGNVRVARKAREVSRESGRPDRPDPASAGRGVQVKLRLLGFVDQQQ